jgi:hypothetical protein
MGETDLRLVTALSAGLGRGPRLTVCRRYTGLRSMPNRRVRSRRAAQVSNNRFPLLRTGNADSVVDHPGRLVMHQNVLRASILSGGRLRLRIQPIDATIWMNRSAGLLEERCSLDAPPAQVTLGPIAQACDRNEASIGADGSAWQPFAADGT